MPDRSRRRFLTSTSLGLAALAAAPTVARAFSLEEPNEDIRRTYELACGDHAAYHRELVAEVKQILAAEGYENPDESRIREAAAAVNCRFCGCPVSDLV